MPVEIYGLPASAPYRIALMAAEVSKLEYVEKHVNLMEKEHMTPEFLKLNPQHNIPVIKDGDLVINESRAIAGYIANQYDKSENLYPKCPKLRAVVDQRMYYDMGVFYKSFGECIYPIMFGGDKPGQDKFDKLKEVLGWSQDMVKGGFAAGDHLTLADLCFVATYSTMKAVGSAGIPFIDDYKGLDEYFNKVIKLIPNYEKANGDGAKQFGDWFKSKLA